MSFLFFYLRLSPNANFQRMVYATMALNTMVTITNWLLAFLQCIPFEAVLHPADYPDAKCIEEDIVLMLPSALVRNVPHYPFIAVQALLLIN